ncbi:MAG: hypothetical protein ACI9UU_003203 [Candidatus Azotimanducaceae bacterium]|jgi:hypothetical protein
MVASIVLVAVRLEPGSAIWAVNALVEDVEITADEPSLGFVPVSFNTPKLLVRTAGIEIELTDIALQGNWLRWWQDEPFWSLHLAHGSVVQIDSEPSIVASSEDGTASGAIAIPVEAFAATALSIGAFRLNNQYELAFELHQETTGDVRTIEIQRLVVKDTSVSSDTPLADVTAKLSYDYSDPRTVELQANWLLWVGELPEQTKIEGTLTGQVDLDDTYSLSIEDLSMNAIVGARESDSVGVFSELSVLKSQLELQYQPQLDRILVESLHADVRLADGMEYVVAADVGVLFAKGAEIELSATVLGAADELGTRIDATLRSMESSLEISAELASDRLPHFVSVGGVTPEQLYPLVVTAKVKSDGTTLNVDQLNVTSPENVFAATLAFGPQPLSVVGNIEAERLSLRLVASDVESSPIPEQANEPQAPITQTEPKQVDPSPVTDAAAEPLFSADTIDLDWLAEGEIDFTVNADILRLQEAEFVDFQIKVAAKDGKLTIQPLIGRLGEGGFNGVVSFSNQSEIPQLAFDFDLQGIALEQFGLVPAEKLSGGDFETHIQLRSSGVSMADLAANLNGEFVFLLESTKLADDVIEIVGSDLVMETLNKLNPFYKDDPNTQIDCALAKFEVNEGLLVSDQLMVETDKMEIIGGAKLSLISEQLDVTFSPSAREGVGVNLGSLVKFVKLGGTLRDPKPEVHAIGLLQSGAAIGAAISTGGVSILAEGLAKRVINAGSACERFRSGEKSATEEPEPESELEQG